MMVPRALKFAVAGVFIANAGVANAELPIVGALGIGGDGLLSSLPLVGGVLGDPIGTVNELTGKLLFVNGGRPALEGVPVLGSLPVLDGRGLPVVRDIEGALLIVDGVLNVVLSTGELGAGVPMPGGQAFSLSDILLNTDSAMNQLLPF